MCHVTIVEQIKLKILLDFPFIDIIQYKKYKIIDISHFSFFIQIRGPKMGFNNPHPLMLFLIFRKHSLLSDLDVAIFKFLLQSF